MLLQQEIKTGYFVYLYLAVVKFINAPFANGKSIFVLLGKSPDTSL